MKISASGDWRPAASLEVLRLRARMLERIRAFFLEREVLEVDTPILSASATPDPSLASFTTRYTGPQFPDGRMFYLQTSPEFPMKRLLASGTGSIYQICKVFRDGECGRLHNPEFTMIEWYRVGLDHLQLMGEVEMLVRHAIQDAIPLKAAEWLTYRDAFERHLQLDPHTATVRDYAEAARRYEIYPPADLLTHQDAAIWRDLLLTHLIEPHLGQDGLTFLYDFPASQASLARVRPGSPPLAERFELYCQGIELANGFHELADPDEQRIRFERQLHTRVAAGMADLPIDGHLLAALQEGLPDCSGVALGFDRLVMLAAGLHQIESVIAFPWDRS